MSIKAGLRTPLARQNWRKGVYARGGSMAHERAAIGEGEWLSDFDIPVFGCVMCDPPSLAVRGTTYCGIQLHSRFSGQLVMTRRVHSRPRSHHVSRRHAGASRRETKGYAVV